MVSIPAAKPTAFEDRLCATFACSPCLPECEDKFHPYEAERRNGFPDSAREPSCRSIRLVAYRVDHRLSRMLPVRIPRRVYLIGFFRGSGDTIFSESASCYTVPEWHANGSGNTSSLIWTGANKSRERYAFRGNRWRRRPNWAAGRTAGSRLEPGTGR